MKKAKDESVKKQTGKVNGHTKHKATHKAKCAMYLQRATCSPCRLVFRSPKKRAIHTDSGHKSMLGVNKKRTPKVSAFQ